MPPGRPPKYKDRESVPTYFEKEIKEDLERTAKLRGQSVNTLVNKIVKDWLAERGAKSVAPISMWFKEVPEPPVAQPQPDAPLKEWNIYLQQCDQATLEKIARTHWIITDLAEQHLERRVKQGNEKVFFKPRLR